MKKLIILGLALALFSACQEQPQRWTTTSPEVDVTKALIKDYEEGNWESWISHYADSAKVYHNSTESVSSQQLGESFKQTLSDYSSYGFSDEEVYYEMIIDDKGDKWVYFWGTWEGTVNKTDKALSVPVHLALQFVDTKIVEEFAFYDTSSLSAALKEKEAARMNEEGYQSNYDIVKGIYDNFAKGDIPAFLAVLDPKVEWNEAENFIYADGSPYIGPDAFTKGVLERLGADWEYWKISELQLTDMSNNMVLATGRYQAKHKNTGKEINAQVAHVWTLKNGKVVIFQQYTDTKQVAEAVE